MAAHTREFLYQNPQPLHKVNAVALEVLGMSFRVWPTNPHNLSLVTTNLTQPFRCSFEFQDEVASQKKVSPVIIALGLFFCHPVFLGRVGCIQCMLRVALTFWKIDSPMNCFDRSKPRSPQPLPLLRIVVILWRIFRLNLWWVEQALRKKIEKTAHESCSKDIYSSWFKTLHMILVYHSQTPQLRKEIWVTLTQTNSSHLKMDGRKFLVYFWSFLGAVGLWVLGSVRFQCKPSNIII